MITPLIIIFLSIIVLVILDNTILKKENNSCNCQCQSQIVSNNSVVINGKEIKFPKDKPIRNFVVKNGKLTVYYEDGSTFIGDENSA